LIRNLIETHNRDFDDSGDGYCNRKSRSIIHSSAGTTKKVGDTDKILDTSKI